MSNFSDACDALPKPPQWRASGRADDAQDRAFLAGADLAHLDHLLAHDAVPLALVRARLALHAAEACVSFSGRVERAKDLRDAVAFLQPGDRPGPAGEVYAAWCRVVSRPISIETARAALPGLPAEAIGTWLDCVKRAPVARAASVLSAVLSDRPRDTRTPLLLADMAMAQSLGWTHVVPLLTLGLSRCDLQKRSDDLSLACYRAVSTAIPLIQREVETLSRRGAHLQAVTPKLRARGASEAIRVFLTNDVVAPTALTSLRSGRAARRFCDRLVALGAVREVTGRETFRLYGV